MNAHTVTVNGLWTKEAKEFRLKKYEKKWTGICEKKILERRKFKVKKEFFNYTKGWSELGNYKN